MRHANTLFISRQHEISSLLKHIETYWQNIKITNTPFWKSQIYKSLVYKMSNKIEKLMNEINVIYNKNICNWHVFLKTAVIH